MTPQTTLDTLVRWWLLVAVAVASCLGAASIYMLTSDPVYTARADVLVSPISIDRAVPGTGVVVESAEPIRAIQTAAALIDTDEAIERTATAMGAGWSPRRVAEAVTVEPRGQSNIVSVSGKATTAAEAAQLTTTFARESMALRAADVRVRAERLLEERLNDVEPDSAEIGELRLLVANGDPSMSVVNDAPVPRDPSSPGPAIVLAVALLLGLLLGGAIGLAVERLASGSLRSHGLRRPWPSSSVPRPDRPRRNGTGAWSPASRRNREQQARDGDAVDQTLRRSSGDSASRTS